MIGKSFGDFSKDWKNMRAFSAGRMPVRERDRPGRGFADNDPPPFRQE